MSPLAHRNDPLVQRALTDARHWCTGRIIDDRPAIVHAVRVAVTLTRHHPTTPPALIAAVLLHDSPEFAPTSLDLDQYLIAGYGPTVLRIVRALQAEHVALDQPNPPVNTTDLPVLLASSADRIVAFGSLIHRARRTGDPTAFFTTRRPLLDLLPHFHACHTAAHGLLPTPMWTALGNALHDLDTITEPARAAHHG